MTGKSSGQILWSPTPSSSSSKGTQLSLDSEENHALDGSHVEAALGEQHDTSLLPNHGDKTNSQRDNDTNDELRRRRYKPKQSSRFLLQHKRAPEIRRSFSPEALSEQARDPKGKRRAEDVDLVIPRRRIDPRSHHAKLAVGSSPLAREVLSSTPPLNNDGHDGFSAEETVPMPSKASRGLQTAEGDLARSDPWSVTNGNEGGKRTSSALGHDTDPAQIVNLALNLSESRRRNVSAGTVLPANIGSMRLPSLTQRHSSIPYNIPPSAGGSLRQYLEQQRYASRNVSPKSSRFRHRDTSSAHLSPRVENTPQSMVSAVYESRLSDGTMFNPSDATLARAEKARITLELHHEYRRLLSNLPALPSSSRNKSVLSRSGGTSIAGNTQGLGRSYNPLQYIRNRKVRVRERRMLDAVADGWKKLDEVRSWVDRVLVEREAGTLMMDGQYSLPVFKAAQTVSPAADTSVEAGSKMSMERQTDKLRRPRLDWSFTPWDLLADAYWLYQDNNIRHVEDASGEKIFLENPNNDGTSPRTSRELVPSTFRRSQSSTRQNFSPEKLPKLFGHSRHNSTERERSQRALHDRKIPVSDGINARDRRSRWTRNPNRSRDSLSSNDSLGLGAQRRSRDNGYFVKDDHPESAVLEKQMREMVKMEAQSINLHQHEKNKGHNINQNAQSGVGTREVLLPAGALTLREDRSTKDGYVTKEIRPAFHTIRHSTSASLDRQQFQPKRRSFDDPDHAGSTSKYAHSYVPSIGVDSSSSISRPTTPKHISSFVTISDQDNRDKERHAMGKRGFEIGSTEAKKAARPEENEDVQNKISVERVSNPGHGSLPVVVPEPSRTKLQHEEPMPGRSSRGTNEQESKLRGFFKGRRIAQLVGNEVHKVGDKLRKKDNLNTLSRVSSVQSGYATDESDLGTDLSALESSPEDPLSVIRNRTEGGRRWHNGSNVDSRPAYHHRRLPSFRSAFVNKPDHPPNTSIALANADHITRQQVAQRARGRPTRFDQLAPPKIDVDQIWPSSSPATSHNYTRGIDLPHDGSRLSSDGRLDNHVHDADRRLKDVLGTPGTLESGKQPVSSVSSLEMHHAHTSSTPNAQEQYRQGSNDQIVTVPSEAVTKRDIARVQALLLSSGVKANEISRRAQEIEALPAAALQSLPKVFQGQFSQVPRSQEHMFTARIIIDHIEATSQRLQNAQEQFVHTSVAQLHSQLRDLDERLTQKFTPAVRSFADDADALSTELTTTHTLNFKQLNDSIEVLMRRRRRRFRWIRRGGYVLLEWTLLGIMWWVWLIVVMVRLVRCTIRALTGSLKWLFWV